MTFNTLPSRFSHLEKAARNYVAKQKALKQNPDEAGEERGPGSRNDKSQTIVFAKGKSLVAYNPQTNTTSPIIEDWGRCFNSLTYSENNLYASYSNGKNIQAVVPLPSMRDLGFESDYLFLERLNGLPVAGMSRQGKYYVYHLEEDSSDFETNKNDIFDDITNNKGEALSIARIENTNGDRIENKNTGEVIFASPYSISHVIPCNDNLYALLRRRKYGKKRFFELHKIEEDSNIPGIPLLEGRGWINDIVSVPQTLVDKILEAKK